MWGCCREGGNWDRPSSPVAAREDVNPCIRLYGVCRVEDGETRINAVRSGHISLNFLDCIRLRTLACEEVFGLWLAAMSDFW